MIKGIGLDLQKIDAVSKALQRPNFAQRIYTQSEWAYIQGKGAAQAQSAAGIWAAKEAVLKALGVGLGAIAFLQIRVDHTETGQPFVTLVDGAQALLKQRGIDRFCLSITHDSGFAAAVCIAEGD